MSDYDPFYVDALDEPAQDTNNYIMPVTKKCKMCGDDFDTIDEKDKFCIGKLCKEQHNQIQNSLRAKERYREAQKKLGNDITGVKICKQCAGSFLFKHKNKTFCSEKCIKASNSIKSSERYREQIRNKRAK
jgi:ribosomal protein S27AE